MRNRALVMLLLAGGLASAALAADNKATMNSNPTNSAVKTETLTVGGGCFWCVEAVFELVDGVTSVVSGYAGGRTENPTYKQVCSGQTGHAEVVRIEFDPTKVSLEHLLNIFWECHDPTSLNRQGADVGTQYRSIILYTDPVQHSAAEKSKAAAQQRFSRPIVTQIAPLAKFYEAELYHQDYFRNNPSQAYCAAVIAPKVEKMRRKLGPR